jgi:BTB/POZ domain
VKRIHESFRGNRNGVGTLTRCVDEKLNWRFEGPLRDRKRDGCGIFTWPNGHCVQREYSDGMLVSEAPAELTDAVRVAASEQVRERTTELDLRAEQLRVDQARREAVAEQLEDRAAAAVTAANTHFTDMQRREQEAAEQSRTDLELELATMRTRQDSALATVRATQEEELEGLRLAHEAAVQTSRLALAEERRRLDEDIAASKKYEEVVTGWVKVNAGGTHYETSVETLMRGGESYFSPILAGQFKDTRDQEGNITFRLDCDGPSFRTVLDFLRTGQLPDDLSAAEIISLNHTASFLQLSDLLTALESR